jgi:hypothetical protein
MPPRKPKARRNAESRRKLATVRRKWPPLYVSCPSVDAVDGQSTEIEGLKSRVKQYGDYDEIKRELEIMKVS